MHHKQKAATNLSLTPPKTNGPSPIERDYITSGFLHLKQPSKISQGENWLVFGDIPKPPSRPNPRVTRCFLMYLKWPTHLLLASYGIWSQPLEVEVDIGGGRFLNSILQGFSSRNLPPGKLKRESTPFLFKLNWIALCNCRGSSCSSWWKFTATLGFHEVFQDNWYFSTSCHLDLRQSAYREGGCWVKRWLPRYDMKRFPRSPWFFPSLNTEKYYVYKNMGVNPKMVGFPNNHGFPTKNDHFWGVKWG